MYPSTYGYGGYGMGGYGGYGMGGYGAGYGTPYMNGGYGVGATPVSTGPLTSTPITPYENTKGELKHVKSTNDGLTQGGVFGALGGAVLFGALGLTAMGPWGLGIGVLMGALGGGFLGGFLGKKFSGYESTNHDAEDDGKINGSTMGADAYTSGKPMYF